MPELPLNGRRVLVTRARGQASALVERLEALGAEVVAIPAIEIAPPRSWCGMDAALATALTYDWTVFTSGNAVRAFVERGRQIGVAARVRKVAVIGPATARAVVESGLATEVALVPERYVAESLAEALAPLAAGKCALLVRAEMARETLPEMLTAAGAVVTIASAYRNVVPEDSLRAVRELFMRGAPDVITFTSASTAVNLRGLLEAAGVAEVNGVVMASIGAVTSAAMREMGWEPGAEAKEATIDGLVQAVQEHFAAADGRG